MQSNEKKIEDEMDVCEYCQGEVEGLSLPCELGNAVAFVEEGLLYMRLTEGGRGNGVDTQFGIKYCPMCGRPLERE